MDQHYRDRGSHKPAKIFLTILLLVIPANSIYPLSPEEQLYARIRREAGWGKLGTARKLSYQFIKKYPSSSRIPDVRFILAESEKSPGEAIKKYRVLVEKYRYYRRRDYAQLRICQIHYLSSQWSDLGEETRHGIKKFPGSRYLPDFRYLLIVACIHQEKYREAERECDLLIKANHGYHAMAGTLLLLGHIYKRTTGYSRKYIYNLRELAIGFPRSERYPSIIYLLGTFYEKKGLINHAYSAYLDCVSRYPGSPEALSAGKRIARLKKHKPRQVKYIPDRRIINREDSIDISHHRDIPEDRDLPVSFAVSIGPFTSVSRVADIKKILREYNLVRTVRMRYGFMIYIGNHNSSESALRTKIRLAEEHGINGNIVRIANSQKRKYIYGE
jgi:TolA-binding protein